MIEEYREVRSKRGLRIIFIILIGVMFSLIFLRLLAKIDKLNLFPIRNVQIYGSSVLTTNSIAKLIGLDSNSTLLLFSKKKAINVLESDKRIKTVEIVRVYPDTLKIQIIEKDRFAVLLAEGKIYLLSKDGTVLSMINKKVNGYPLITIKSFNDDIIVGREIGNFIVRSILQSIWDIKGKYPNFYKSIYSFLIDEAGVYLKLNNANANIYLGNNINSEKLERLRALLIVLKNNYSEFDTDQLEIDLSFSNAAVKGELKDELR